MTTKAHGMQRRMKSLRGLPMDNYATTRPGSDLPSTTRSSVPLPQASLPDSRPRSEQVPMTSVQASQASTRSRADQTQGGDTGSLQNHPTRNATRDNSVERENPPDEPAFQPGHRRSPSQDVIYATGGPPGSAESHPPIIDHADLHDPEQPAGSGQGNQEPEPTHQTRH